MTWRKVLKLADDYPGMTSVIAVFIGLGIVGGICSGLLYGFLWLMNTYYVP